MAFWNDAKLEPLRQYRWYLRFAKESLVGTSIQDFSFAIKNCTKPEYEIGVTEHTLLTHTFRYPTILKWKPITIKYVSANKSVGISQPSALIKDPTQAISSVSSVLHHMLEQESGYNNPNSKIGHQQISKNIISDSLSPASFEIVQVDEKGNEIEIWTIYNGFISGVKYGILDYESEQFVEVELNIQYDWADLALRKKA